MWVHLPETDQIRLRETANKLLAINFLVKEKDRESYMSIKKNQKELRQFFQQIGWELVIDDLYEYVFLYTEEHDLKKRLSKEETIWFLIIRLIYQEKRQSLSTSSFPLTSTHEIKTKYETFKLPWINLTALEHNITLCRRYHLLEASNTNYRDEECRFSLYHTWQQVLRTEDFEVLEAKINNFAGKARGIDEITEEATLN